MSHLVAAFAPGASRVLRETAWEGTAVTDTALENAAFALVARPGDGLAENGGLFESPDGRCRGVLSGYVFELDEQLAESAATLPRRQRLGLFFQRLCQRHGLDFPRRLDGAFALALWSDGRCFAARDAIGERPLYVLENAGRFVLADRMGPLVRHPLGSRRLDAGGVADYLQTGFCPFERTPVEGLRALGPRTTFCLEPGSGTPRLAVYRRLPIGSDVDLDEAQHVERIRARLKAAVARRLVPGARASLLLSGGLDSSLVGALLGAGRLEAAYSLSFGEGLRNELAFSSLMARELGLAQRVVTLGAREVREALPETLRVLDAPIGDPLTVPNLLVAKRAAGDGAQVLFNGEGGDPLFGGPKNLRLLAIEAFGGAAALGKSPAEVYLESYNKGAGELRTLLTGAFRAELRERPTSAELLAPWLDPVEGRTLVDRLMRVNLRLKGAAQILPKVFKIASAQGLHVRSPLFDRDLADAAFQVPPGLKLKGTREKHVLKEAARGLVPEGILERPKSGMLVPVEHWFRGPLKELAHDLLLGPGARTRPILRPGRVARLLAFELGGVKAYHGDRIWLLVSLEMWLRVHGL